MTLKIGIVVICFTVVAFPVVECLSCHHCADQVREDQCRVDMKRLKKVFKTGDEGPGGWARNCSSNPNYTVCAIEEVKSQGEVHSLIRDCSDGKLFSFPKDGVMAFLQPDNETICQFRGNGYQVCITLCNGSDYCNGPSSSNVLSWSYLVALFGGFLHVLLRV